MGGRATSGRGLNTRGPRGPGAARPLPPRYARNDLHGPGAASKSAELPGELRSSWRRGAYDPVGPVGLARTRRRGRRTWHRTQPYGVTRVSVEQVHVSVHRERRRVVPEPLLDLTAFECAPILLQATRI